MTDPNPAQRRDWFSGRVAERPDGLIYTRPLDVATCRTLVSLERWKVKVEHQANGCHRWTAARDIGGYGVVGLPNVQVKVRSHRVSWVAAHGEDIPRGLSIDHLCRNRACVNPDHLEAVTIRVNIKRANTASTINASRTHCPAGHPLDGPDAELVAASLKKGQRVCGVCNRERLQTIRAAARHLGLTQKAYGAAYGFAVADARRILNGEAS